MEQIKFSPGLEAMTGEVRFKLTNNVTFLCTMQHSKTALKGLICALLGFKLSEVRDVILLFKFQPQCARLKFNRIGDG
ncbi:MAG: hypothetical protein IJ608_14650 [Lachnospiraceae bacterium]|nr:hypothetical protein [Lachnospiraceae bacterium]